MITIYGIKNCDTVRKALKWAEEQGIAHEFHDFRKKPVSENRVKRWDEAVGRNKLVNKRGTTYRKLDEDSRAALEAGEPYTMLRDEPTLMKRPIFELSDTIIVGFTASEQCEILGKLK